MKKTLLILFFLALGQAGFAFSPNIVKQGKMEVTAHFTNTIVVSITNPQLCGAWEPAAELYGKTLLRYDRLQYECLRPECAKCYLRNSLS